MPQSLSQLYVHLIFSTKHCEPMLLSTVRKALHAYLVAVLNNQDSPALKVGCTSDHVHALFRLSKNLALAKIVEEVKTSSSKWLKTQGRGLANFHWQAGGCPGRPCGPPLQRAWGGSRSSLARPRALLDRGSTRRQRR